jgi:hypothetical protein
VVVGAGGFLGLGEHDVAIPYSQISWMYLPAGQSRASTAPVVSSTGIIMSPTYAWQLVIARSPSGLFPTQPRIAKQTRDPPAIAPRARTPGAAQPVWHTSPHMDEDTKDIHFKGSHGHQGGVQRGGREP